MRSVRNGGWLSPEPLCERLGLVDTGLPARAYLLVTVGSLVPLGVALALAVALEGVLPADPTFAGVFENLTPFSGLVFILLIAVVPGICEELLFRGFVQRRLLQRWRPSVAIGVTSVMFALAHIMPLNIVVVFPLGLWIGYVAWRTGSVVAGMLCHAFINGSLNAWRLLVKFLDIPETVQWGIVIAAGIIGFASFLLAIRELSKPGDPLESQR